MAMVSLKETQHRIRVEQDKIERLAEALVRAQSYLEGMGYSVEFIDPHGWLQDIISGALMDRDLTHVQALAQAEDHRRWLLKMMHQEMKKVEDPLVAWYRSEPGRECSGPLGEVFELAKRLAVARDVPEFRSDCPF
jgi:hypothetical protein